MDNQYAFINAKLKARVGDLLPEDFFHRLNASRTLPEAVQLLGDTDYSLLRDIYTRTGDLKSAELALIKKELEEWKALEPWFPEESRPFYREYYRIYEIESVKGALRLWFDLRVRKRNINNLIGYLSREPVIEKLDYDSLIHAENSTDFLTWLKDTPYQPVLEPVMEKIIENKSIFIPEMKLDLLYFTRLHEALSGLSREDKKDAAVYFSCEADYQNAIWAYRLRLMDAARPEYFLKGGKKITQDYYSRLCLADESQFFDMLNKIFRHLSESAGGREPDFDALLGDYHREQALLARRLLAGSPFTIGIFLAYSLLRKQESERIRTVLNARYYNMDKEL